MNKRTKLAIGLILLAVLMTALCGGGAYFFWYNFMRGNPIFKPFD